jgi:hypothetical protein
MFIYLILETMRWARHVARTGANSHRILVVKSEVKRPLGEDLFASGRIILKELVECSEGR